MIENHLEEWRPVVGWESVYSVSNFGRVRRDVDGLNGAKAGNILKPILVDRGYLKVNLFLKGKRKNATIHVLVAAAFISERPDGHFVNHKDGIKTNNNLSNLEYVTPKENAQHAAKIGLCPKGENHHSRIHPERLTRGDKHGSTKLKDAILPQVFELRRKGLLQREIGKILGLSQAQIGRILKGESRKPKHVFQVASIEAA